MNAIRIDTTIDEAIAQALPALLGIYDASSTIGASPRIPSTS